MAEYGFPCGESIRRQFHYKWCVLAFNNKPCKHLANYYCHDNADDVNCHHDKRLVLHSKESADNHYIYGNTCFAAHQRQNKHCDKSASAAFDGSRCHHGRNITAKAHEQWNERFTMKSDFVHEFVC